MAPLVTVSQSKGTELHGFYELGGKSPLRVHTSRVTMQVRGKNQEVSNEMCLL